eukprot:2292658-Pyramimonas_sp.AAC.1
MARSSIFLTAASPLLSGNAPERGAPPIAYGRMSVTKPSGQAASGTVAAARAAQPPRGPALAPVTCVQGAKTP